MSHLQPSEIMSFSACLARSFVINLCLIALIRRYDVPARDIPCILAVFLAMASSTIAVPFSSFAMALRRLRGWPYGGQRITKERS